MNAASLIDARVYSAVRLADHLRTITVAGGSVWIELVLPTGKPAPDPVVIPRSIAGRVLATIDRARDPNMHRKSRALDRFTRANGDVWLFDERRNPPAILFRLELHTGHRATEATAMITDPELAALARALRAIHQPTSSRT